MSLKTSSLVLLIIIIALIGGIAFGTVNLIVGKHCDNREYTLKVDYVQGFSTSSQSYIARGVYYYPPEQKGQELYFSYDKPILMGQYFDRCITINRYSGDTYPHPEDFQLAPSKPQTAPLEYQLN